MNRPKTIIAILVASAAALLGGSAAQAASPAVEGSVFAGEVVPAPAGCSTDPASGPAPTIDWGDQTPFSPGVCTQNPSGVSTGPHTYAEEGDYSAVAHYSSPNGVRSTPFSVHVDDAALSSSGAAISATAGAPFSGVVAHFSDADPNGATADYTATISWGDGSTSPGSVQPAGAGFDVSGGHTYASAGSYPLTVAVGDAGGASTNASGSATVGPGSTTTTTSASTLGHRRHDGRAGTGQASRCRPALTCGKGRRLAPGGRDATRPPARQPGVTIGTYQWTVNGRQLANCAGATSELMTRTLPSGSDTIALRLLGASGGSLATTSHTIVVQQTASRARAASARARLHIINLPAEAVCRVGPNDPASGRVSPRRTHPISRAEPRCSPESSTRSAA